MSYSVSDGTTPVSNSIHINVAAVNDAPVNSAAVALTTTEDSSLIIRQSDLIANTTDVDGNALTVSNITVPSNQEIGRASCRERV